MIILLSAAVAYGVVYSIIVILKKDGKDKKAAGSDATASTQMQLQAYERLILLVDRIALPNLIARLGKHVVEKCRTLDSPPHCNRSVSNRE